MQRFLETLKPDGTIHLFDDERRHENDRGANDNGKQQRGHRGHRSVERGEEREGETADGDRMVEEGERKMLQDVQRCPREHGPRDW
mmetsp:Transcript_19803/g.27653  ORF Transcript_19803/g.27653 Transcript_19803/m.27653 type:complete len:86 (+) Transcript_19803:364-621(+)